jgi:hypothetical protein
MDVTYDGGTGAAGVVNVPAVLEYDSVDWDDAETSSWVSCGWVRLGDRALLVSL